MDCEYKCQRCNCKFITKQPGPVTCPQCNYLYIDWLNYKQVLKDIEKQEKNKESK